MNHTRVNRLLNRTSERIVNEASFKREVVDDIINQIKKKNSGIDSAVELQLRDALYSSGLSPMNLSKIYYGAFDDTTSPFLVFFDDLINNGIEQIAIPPLEQQDAMNTEVKAPEAVSSDNVITPDVIASSMRASQVQNTDGKVSITINLDPEKMKILSDIASSTGMTPEQLINNFIDRMVNEYLNNQAIKNNNVQPALDPQPVLEPKPVVNNSTFGNPTPTSQPKPVVDSPMPSTQPKPANDNLTKEQIEEIFAILEAKGLSRLDPVLATYVPMMKLDAYNHIIEYAKQDRQLEAFSDYLDSMSKFLDMELKRKNLRDCLKYVGLDHDYEMMGSLEHIEEDVMNDIFRYVSSADRASRLRYHIDLVKNNSNTNSRPIDNTPPPPPPSGPAATPMEANSFDSLVKKIFDDAKNNALNPYYDLYKKALESLDFAREKNIAILKSFTNVTEDLAKNIILAYDRTDDFDDPAFKPIFDALNPYYTKKEIINIIKSIEVNDPIIRITNQRLRKIEQKINSMAYSHNSIYEDFIESDNYLKFKREYDAIKDEALRNPGTSGLDVKARVQELVNKSGVMKGMQQEIVSSLSSYIVSDTDKFVVKMRRHLADYKSSLTSSIEKRIKKYVERETKVQSNDKAYLDNLAKIHDKTGNVSKDDKRKAKAAIRASRKDVRRAAWKRDFAKSKLKRAELYLDLKTTFERFGYSMSGLPSSFAHSTFGRALTDKIDKLKILKGTLRGYNTQPEFEIDTPIYETPEVSVNNVPSSSPTNAMPNEPEFASPLDYSDPYYNMPPMVAATPEASFASPATYAMPRSDEYIENSSLAQVANQIAELNPTVDVKIVNPDVSLQQAHASTIYMDGTPESLVYPQGYYYNQKNGITNKGNTGSGLYQNFTVGNILDVDPGMLVDPSEVLGYSMR